MNFAHVQTHALRSLAQSPSMSRSPEAVAPSPAGPAATSRSSNPSGLQAQLAAVTLRHRPSPPSPTSPSSSLGANPSVPKATSATYSPPPPPPLPLLSRSPSPQRMFPVPSAMSEPPLSARRQSPPSTSAPVAVPHLQHSQSLSGRLSPSPPSSRAPPPPPPPPPGPLAHAQHHIRAVQAREASKATCESQHSSGPPQATGHLALSQGRPPGLTPAATPRTQHGTDSRFGRQHLSGSSGSSASYTGQQAQESSLQRMQPQDWLWWYTPETKHFCMQ